MSSELRELYQETIIDHGRRPRNHQVMGHASHHAEGFNPLCGDKVTVFLLIENDIIKEITFDGIGCAISMASASIMTQQLKGKSLQQAEQLFTDFHTIMTAKSDPDMDACMAIGKLQVLLGVREFPTRVKCATLAWHTLHNALLKDNALACSETVE